MELQDVLRRIRIAGFAFIGILAIGTLGFWVISDDDWFTAFYMTSITITTIGFHEVIDLSNSVGGRAFTVFIAFSGIGIFTYFLSNLAAFFVEGDIRKAFYRRSMEKNIKKMTDHLIICGCGRVGGNIAEELHSTKRDFVVADIEEAALEALDEKLLSSSFLTGDCTEDAFLKKLGIDEAKGIFVTTGNDNTNLVICLTARQLNPEIRIVVRILDIDLSQKMKRAGADKIVSPNYIGGFRMASEMLRPTATSFLDDMVRDSRENIRLEEMIAPDNFQNQPIGEVGKGCKNTLILGVKVDGHWQYNPEKDLLVKKGSIIIMMTTPEDRMILEKQLS